MLTSTVKSYLYEQYQDDDSCAAFVQAYNEATQSYVDWFASVSLPVYTGLSGDLLDWIAAGLYGHERTTLADPLTPALGPLNTETLNSDTLNHFQPPATTFYTLSDDVFQRILTWNLYKGDGKRFCMRFLKRRIMRFLLGVNGTDPVPGSPGFKVGVDNTQALSVTVNSSTMVLTVTINQTLLSTFTSVTPGILTLFQLAFQGGQLDLPIQYTYVCLIVSALTAMISHNTLTVEGSTATLTTAETIVSPVAGTGSYSFAWTWASGGAGISIDSPSTGGTTFTAAGMAWGETRTGLALCTVTDTLSTLTGTASCLVTIICIPPPQLDAENFNWLLTEAAVPLLLEP